MIDRFVAGESLDDAMVATRQLVAHGLLVSIDRLGESTTDAAQAQATADAYVELLDAIAAAGLSEFAEVSLKLSSLGQALMSDGEQIALDHALTVCAAAKAAGTTVTLDMEDHTTTDSTLAVLAELRADFPDTGAVLQAYLRRTEGDCRDLATPGSRVRLCKGAYREPASVAFQKAAEFDRSYVRCLNILLAGAGYPMFATHDPRLIAIAADRAAHHGKAPAAYEFQMLFGIRPDEQRRLAAAGHTVRVYVPYGAQWYGYLMRRLAERPANLAFFGRALFSKG
jgi:proline dehydrogenase